MVPVISLSQETRDDIVNIFERINRTGLGLSLFDLLAARLYIKGVDLRFLWEEFKKGHNDIAAVIKPEFLVKVISILEDQEPKKSNLLNVLDKLDAKVFQGRWEEAVYAIKEAYQRVVKLYGAFNQAWIPYTTIIVPLAVLLYKLKNEGAGQDAYRKVDRWYWASVLSQRYDSAVDTTSYRDVRDISQWIDGEEEPDWINRLTADIVNFDKVEESRSAIYRGLMCLVARKGAKDFLTGQSVQLHECQDDHIFPKSRYREFSAVNSILNRTLISRETNREKGDKLPSVFLQECLVRHGGDEARLQETLQSHFIDKDAYEAMKQNDFAGWSCKELCVWPWC